METTIFEQIKGKCPKKKVVSLANKLAKKLSFKSGADCENLCRLAYWLYVYGEKELAMDCIALTHDIPFEHDYNVWTFIHDMWGLEIRLLREQGSGAEADRIARTIDTQLLSPSKLIDTPEKQQVREAKRRARFTYEDAINHDNVERHLQANDLASANRWRFTALLGMIGDTETGLYPLLNESKAKIEEKIAEYIAELTKLK
ncbi:MAG: hypothetical protein LBI87_00290 [Candidatus Accumulibacter sp.]|jgi:predicted ATPase|nr:hypothetical protein [Accumulibacter sp.]